MKEEIKGKFIGNIKGFGFVEIEDNSNAEDIFIPVNSTNGALNGDTVIAEILENQFAGKRQEGKIIKILKRDKTSLVGVFQSSKNFGFVVPDDKKFGSDIFVSKENIKRAKNRQKVVVEIIKYPENRKECRRKDNRNIRSCR